MASYNQCIILGNVCSDPKVSEFQNGNMKKADFRIACTEKGYTKRDGSKVADRTDFISCVVWGGLVKVIESYVKRGTPLLLQGKIRVDNWEKDGQKHERTYLSVTELQLLGKAADSSAAIVNNPSSGQNGANASDGASQVANAAPVKTETSSDLPF